jgi:hypothetical protein
MAILIQRNTKKKKIFVKMYNSKLIFWPNTLWVVLFQAGVSISLFKGTPCAFLEFESHWHTKLILESKWKNNEIILLLKSTSKKDKEEFLSKVRSTSFYTNSEYVATTVEKGKDFSIKICVNATKCCSRWCEMYGTEGTDNLLNK